MLDGEEKKEKKTQRRVTEQKPRQRRWPRRRRRSSQKKDDEDQSKSKTKLEINTQIRSKRTRCNVGKPSKPVHPKAPSSEICFLHRYVSNFGTNY